MLTPARALAGLLVAPLLPVCAQQPEAWTLARVLDVARRQNPDLVTARLRVDSARAERTIARALPNPTYFGIPGNPYQYSVALPIDLSPERLYRTQAARRGEGIAEFGRRDMLRQVDFNVRQGFYDLLLADAQRQIAREQGDTFKQLLIADSVRVRAGDLPERDLVKSELEFARAEAALTRADAGVRAARLALQALMGVADPDTGFTIAGDLQSAPELTVPIDSLLPLALANRPDIAAAREQVDQSRSLKALATAGLFPVPVVSVVYQNTPFESGSRYAFGVSLPIPLFYWNSGERQRASAGLSAAAVAVQRAGVQIQSDVAVAVGSFQAARVLAERYRSGLLEQAAAALETARFAYQQGAVSLLELLDAIRTYGDTRSEYYSTMHDYWVAAYALRRAVGVEVVRE
ncbi:MAG TPA: TolC family protein [Gemmatimonadales bacterium]|nr:TolC family protein [Gemmatimonadales bacterium]